MDTTALTDTALPRKRKEPVYPVSGEEIVFDEELHEEGRFLTPLLRKLAELEAAAANHGG